MFGRGLRDKCGETGSKRGKKRKEIKLNCNEKLQALISYRKWERKRFNIRKSVCERNWT
jgi:hypothetical protein